MNGAAIGIIPARFASSRFPGKPLAELGGKPMIQHVFERASRSSLLSSLLVATDDERIAHCVREFGGEAVMTPDSLQSGTDRAAHVVRDLDVEIVVNIQGDEPFIEPGNIDAVIGILMKDPSAQMGTLVRRIQTQEELFSAGTAKVVVSDAWKALYFSRNPIPFVRDADPVMWLDLHPFYKHIGLYSYRKSFLMRFHGWQPSSLERSEKLEQLRALEHGTAVHVALTDYDPICVDTPDDLERARKHLESTDAAMQGRSC